MSDELQSERLHNERQDVKEVDQNSARDRSEVQGPQSGPTSKEPVGNRLQREKPQKLGRELDVGFSKPVLAPGGKIAARPSICRERFAHFQEPRSRVAALQDPRGARDRGSRSRSPWRDSSAPRLGEYV